ncbi:MAG: L-erythro-3,5-diaminohexanoate dehydrogenase [Candidatus Firestonebacteria bacterium RIFOXYC2_FULL_39_67]|nr:MAG: L-erythro-3,5-diaminohexanoate dehydrogenase [Candidatus Firestonebacteria bacterium RIFOXYD2_FULL_39_29]OGF53323.1 MAG: L-erythro-3,5-diaminohexanoate dehydrogenase [Candidatus Firestonebacteria bacterium RifOxyC12_full_39_7]OGF56146.1 MAG: L-erythro-3,5-diaminohexanoate dehydrogenase [Candidatus Firestonebacteria bacterium RIFOXYC2_FULL_39_67]
MLGSKYGTHRVIEKKGLMPQTAFKLDNNMDKLYDNEILIAVQTLNVDSASFTQIEKQAKGDDNKIREIMMATVKERGKHQNPVTGSGGVLIGTVEKIGSALKGKIDIKEGDKIVTLVSLSLTPLRIDKIKDIRKDIDQVDIDGKAILFEKTIYSKIPKDIDESLALAALDVAGAPAQTRRLVKKGDTVFIIGAGGKSGILCAYEAKKKAGKTGYIIGTGHSDESTKRIKEMGFCDEVIQINATNPLEVEEKVAALTKGKMADVTINCVNVPETEMASVLATKEDGIIYFFSMATSFTRAALGAEGIAKDITMIIGNGYAKDHAKITLDILRESKKIRELFTKMFVSK